MAAASKIPQAHFQSWLGWCVLTPGGDPIGRTITDSRRNAIAAWQALFPRKTWRKCYAQGFRAVRVVLTLHPGSCTTVRNDALADCPRPSGLIPSADDKSHDEGAPDGATNDNARNH